MKCKGYGNEDLILKEKSFNCIRGIQKLFLYVTYGTASLVLTAGSCLTEFYWTISLTRRCPNLDYIPNYPEWYTCVSKRFQICAFHSANASQLSVTTFSVSFKIGIIWFDVCIYLFYFLGYHAARLLYLQVKIYSTSYSSNIGLVLIYSVYFMGLPPRSHLSERYIFAPQNRQFS